MRLSSARVGQLVAAVLLGLLVARAAQVAWVCDDAFITFRTVDYVLEGRGPRWNAAERVQTYTHPLWMLLLAATTAATRDAYRTAMVAGVVLTALVGLIVLRRIAVRPWSGALALALLALSPSFADYATSGLENPLLHVWLAAFWALLFGGAAPPSSRRVRALGIVVGLAMCTRLDALVLVLPAWVWVLARAPRRAAVHSVLHAAFPVVAWHAFALVYYGALLPNSATAKLTSGFDAVAMWSKGAQYLASCGLHDPVAAIAVVIAAWIAFRRGGAERAAAAGIAAHLVYVIAVGGDFMSGRFITGCTLTAAALWARVVWPWRAALGALAVAIAGALAAPGSPLRPIPAAGPRLERTIDARGIADERRFYAPLTSWSARGGRVPWPDPGTAAAVRDAHHNWDVDPFVDLLRAIDIVSREDSVAAAAFDAARAGRTRPVVLVPAVGTFGWYAGASLHVLDIYGLGDPLLARLPAVRPDPLLGRFAPRLATLGWRQGHFIRRVPAGYVATLLSGENQLHDADLARYWDDVALATRAPLFAPGRWAAIARLLRGDRDPRLARARARIAAARSAPR